MSSQELSAPPAPSTTPGQAAAATAATALPPSPEPPAATGSTAAGSPPRQMVDDAAGMQKLTPALTAPISAIPEVAPLKRDPPPSHAPLAAASGTATDSKSQDIPAKTAKAEDHYPSPPEGPPTPAATTTTTPESFTVPLPSFVHDDPLSSDPDSSSDEDTFGEPKPPRTKRFSKSTGLVRPVPSYYYDAEYDPGTAGNKKRGRRGGYKGVPVFEPTLKDFAENGGFYGYVKRIEKYGLRSGIVKVVPPKEWTDSLPPVDKPLRAIRLRDAIEQHMVGSQGLYRVMNEAKTRTWNPAQWKDLATRPKWEAPDLVGDEKKGERSERAVISDRARKMRATRSGGSNVGDKKGKGRANDDEAEDADEDGEDEDDNGSSKRRTPARRAKVDGAAKMAASQTKSRVKSASGVAGDAGNTAEPETSTSSESPAKKRRSSMAPAHPSDEEWAAFIAGLSELPHGMSRDDYTVERMRDFERRYWRTLTFGEPPMYGADMAGSLFDDSTKAWNVAHLGDLLPKLAPRGCEIPGVVTPYLYFGMWRATFAWHVEDADLYSINYIHFGAPKFWYSVPQEQSERFERVMAGLFPTDRSKCSQFLRHKSFLASPKILTNNGITLNRCVQLPGEFILTYPKGYHSGFNLGFNCAESINFATERWLPLGKVTKHCQCIEDSVNIDVTTWLRQAAKDEHLDRGDPWPYDELEEKALLAQIEAEERAEAERIQREKEKAAADAAAVLARKRAAAAASAGERPAKKPKPVYQVPMVLMPAVPGVPPAGPLYTLSILQALQSPDVLPEIKGQLAHLIQHPSGTWRLETPVRFQVVPHPNPPPPPPPVPRTKVEPNPYSSQAFHYPKQGVQPKPSSSSNASSSSSPAPRQGSASAAVQPTGLAPIAGPASTPAAAAPAAPPKPEFACALCPDPSSEGLVAIGEPGVKSTKKRMSAHRVCVMFTPATWIEVDPESKEELVRGFAKIEKARWKLKCQLCPESHGTKVQCTKGKCIKAFHVTCALRDGSGVYLDATIPDLEGSGGPISILDQTRATTPPPAPAPGAHGEEKPALPSADVAEPKDTMAEAAPPSADTSTTNAVAAAPSTPSTSTLANNAIHLTVLCRTHNPEWQQLEAERKATELREKVDRLQRGDRIRVRTNGGTYDVQYEGRNVDAESIDYVFEDGKRATIKWKMIVWPESLEKQRKKVEAAARAEREKLAVLDRPAYRAPVKRASSATLPVAIPAVAPIAPPPQYGQPYYPQPAQPAPRPAMQAVYGGPAMPATTTGPVPYAHTQAQAQQVRPGGYPSSHAARPEAYPAPASAQMHPRPPAYSGYPGNHAAVAPGYRHPAAPQLPSPPQGAYYSCSYRQPPPVQQQQQQQQQYRQSGDTPRPWGPTYPGGPGAAPPSAARPPFSSYASASASAAGQASAPAHPYAMLQPHANLPGHPSIPRG